MTILILVCNRLVLCSIPLSPREEPSQLIADSSFCSSAAVPKQSQTLHLSLLHKSARSQNPRISFSLCLLVLPVCVLPSCHKPINPTWFFFGCVPGSLWLESMDTVVSSSVLGSPLPPSWVPVSTITHLESEFKRASSGNSLPVFKYRLHCRLAV